MIFSVAVIIIAGVIAYIWSARGFFSAFLHMLCVIVAGALAFAFWEPLGLWLLSSDTTQGGTLIDIAWGLALGVPFAIILTILRVACDKLVPFNLEFDGPANLVGGLACGLVSGTITAGMLVMSIGFMRGDTNFMGYEPMQYSSGGGSLQRKESLLYPADRLTAWFYGTLSNSTFVPPSGESLGRWHPNLSNEPWMMRVTWEDGKGKSALAPEAFQVIARHTVSNDKNPQDLLMDSFEPGRKETFEYADGTKPNLAQSHLDDFVVKFKSQAKEQSGRVVVGPGQVRLLVQTDQNDPYSTMDIQPVSVISQADGAKSTLGRWRFNAPKVFISSVGGRDDAPMVFEFISPNGSKPLALYVKGVRYDVSDMPVTSTFGSTASRDDAIRSTAIAPEQPSEKINWSGAAQVKIDPNNFNAAIRVTDVLPMRIILQKDVLQGLEVDDTQAVSGGALAKFNKNMLAGFGVDPHLQVRKFATTDDTSIVQVTVDGTNKEFGFLSTVAANMDRGKRPLLIDAGGQQFSAIGYVYQGAGETWIYFSPQAPLQSTTDREMPVLTRSQPDQQLTLIFRVSKGVKLKGFSVGQDALAEFKPELDVK